MTDKKIITVFCATGAQGNSVAKALNQDPSFHVRAVTRDVNGAKAQVLKDLGVEIVQCNLSDINSLKDALSGAHGCFVVTFTQFENSNSYEMEKHEGRLIADACKAMRVNHVVFSTQRSSRVLGIQTAHLDAKAEVETYMHDLDLPLTCVMVPFYYEQLLGMFKPEKVSTNEYILEIPMGTTHLHLISIEDVGHVVREMFRQKGGFIEKTIGVCGDTLTVRDMAATLTAGLYPKTFRDKPLTVNDYRKKKCFLGVDDWANMFNFRLRVDQKFNVQYTKSVYPRLQHFDRWVQSHRDALMQAFE